MDIREIKKYEKRVIIPVYLGEKTFCDGCVARGGSQFKNITQSIYLTSIHPERSPDGIEAKYCYNCARKEAQKILRQIDECYYKNEREKDAENSKEPELVRCFKCDKIEDETEGKEGKFKRHGGNKYCIDCLYKVNDVLTAVSNYNNKG